MGRTDFYILNDPELSFRDTVNKNVMSAVSGSVLKSEFLPASIKSEKPDGDILRVDQNQIVVKLEKGEGTLQIEKVGSSVKKEPTQEKSVSVDISFVKTEPEDPAQPLVAEGEKPQPTTAVAESEKTESAVDGSDRKVEDKVDDSDKVVRPNDDVDSITVCMKIVAVADFCQATAEVDPKKLLLNELCRKYFDNCSKYFMTKIL